MRLREEHGQVMVLTVLCMAVLLGFVAFASDVGIMLHAKSELQSAVDAAAIAGAAEINEGDITAAAEADAKQNGVDDTVTGTTLTVHNPPSSGPHMASTNYVEVIATQVEPTFFMKLFNEGSMTVTARAVATRIASPTCLFTLSANPPGGAGVQTTAPGLLVAQDCGIADDATGSDAISVVGGASIVAKTVAVVGGANGGSIVATPVTGIAPVSDPLSYLAQPTPASCVNDPHITTGTVTLPAPTGGVACYNGLSISGATTNVTMPPGLYIMNGSPLSVSSAATVTGTDVTIFFTGFPASNSLVVNGANLDLTAPTTGTYGGVVLFEDRNDAAPTVSIANGSCGQLSGVVYLSTAQLNIANGSVCPAGSPYSFFDLNNVSLVVGSFLTTDSVTIDGYGPGIGLSPAFTPSLTE
jgi:Flp pilus assembly protein TadG